MPTALAFLLGTAAVAVVLWLAFAALTGDSVPVVGTARGALIAIVIVGMAACGVAGIGQATTIGWTHPITVFGIVVGIVALVLAGAGLFGWDSVVRPAADVVPMGAAVAATTERLAIGLLAALIAVKWVVGIPLSILASRG
jgi:hypothetical protein